MEIKNGTLLNEPTIAIVSQSHGNTFSSPYAIYVLQRARLRYDFDTELAGYVVCSLAWGFKFGHFAQIQNLLCRVASLLFRVRSSSSETNNRILNLNFFKRRSCFQSVQLAITTHNEVTVTMRFCFAILFSLAAASTSGFAPTVRNPTCIRSVPMKVILLLNPIV
jgi:hypothetical protein